MAWTSGYGHHAHLACVQVRDAHIHHHLPESQGKAPHYLSLHRFAIVRWRSAFIVGISWFRDTAVTYFPNDDIGDARFEYFKQVVSIEPLDKVLAPFTNELSDAGVALFTFLYVDFLDTSVRLMLVFIRSISRYSSCLYFQGTLLGIVSAMGYVNEEGDFPKSHFAYSADALATIFGSIFGLSPVTSYIESGSGVEAGSRTGLTAVFCGVFFFLSLFFAPIIASIPAWAIGGALVIVGSLMARSLAKVKWYDITDAATAFITVMVMPLTYSIAYGLIAGIGTYVVMQGTFHFLTLFGIEKPVFEDPALSQQQKAVDQTNSTKKDEKSDEDDDDENA